MFSSNSYNVIDVSVFGKWLPLSTDILFATLSVASRCCLHLCVYLYIYSIIVLEHYYGRFDFINMVYNAPPVIFSPCGDSSLQHPSLLALPCNTPNGNLVVCTFFRRISSHVRHGCHAPRVSGDDS